MTNTRKVKKLVGLGTPPEKLVLGITKSSKAKNTGIFIYSDNVGNKNGKLFSQFIEENNLGLIQKTTQFRNPNNGHTIQAWMWIVNWENVTIWAAKQPELSQYERVY